MTIGEYVEMLQNIIEVLEEYDQTESIEPFVNEDNTITYLIGDDIINQHHVKS